MTSVQNGQNISNEAVIVWYQAILNRYNSVNSANSNIDTKSGVVLAAAVAVLIYLAQVSTAPRVLSLLAAVGLLTTVAIGIRNIYVKNTSTEVHTAKEKEEYYAKDDEGFYWQLIADLQDSLEKVDAINSIKGRLYKRMVYMFTISSLLAMLSLYIKLTVTLGWG